jgi:hypothetical protein
LGALNLSATPLGGDAASALRCVAAVTGSALASLDLSHTPLGGALPAESLFARLSSLSLVATNLAINSSAAPAAAARALAPALIFLDLRGCGGVALLDGLAALEWEGATTIDGTVGLACPHLAVIGDPFDTSLRLDLAAFGFARCACGGRRVWDPARGRCSPCPPHAVCGTAVWARGVALTPAENFYPVNATSGALVARLGPSDSLDELVLLRCQADGVCNPGMADATPSSNAADDATLPPPPPFEGAEGHDPHAVLCSRCLAGYYTVGTRCVRCTDALRAMSPLVDLALLVGGLLWIWRSEWSHSSAKIAIAVFFLQATAILEQSATALGSASREFASIGAPHGAQSALL